MRSQQLEAWVLTVVDCVKTGHKVEDSRIELKSDWPEPTKAARRMAAHANAARGDNVLWLIGLDESRGVVPISPTDFAEWYSKVVQQFEGVSPSVQELVVPTTEGAVLALLIDTSRAPYVVRNPAYGTMNGGPVELEVPWREGTAVRTARRDDLLKLLVPLQKLPSVEVLSARAVVSLQPATEAMYRNQVPPVQHSPHLWWELFLRLYVTPHDRDRVVFPLHKVRLLFRIGDDPQNSQVSTLRLTAPFVHTGQSFRRDSHTVLTTSAEAILDGPGRLEVTGTLPEPPRTVPEGTLELALIMTPAGEDRPVAITLNLTPGELEADQRRRWVLVGEAESA